MAGVEIYETGGPANDESIEFLELSGWGILGRQSVIN